MRPEGLTSQIYMQTPCKVRTQGPHDFLQISTIAMSVGYPPQPGPRSMVSSPTPLGASHFTLNTLGLASLLGGSETIFSLALVYVYTGRRWLGWYNSPGSYFLGMRLARIARANPILNFISMSQVNSEQSHAGQHVDPAELFEWDGRKGPKFRAIHSGTMIDDTGHFAALFLKECAERRSVKIPGTVTRSVDLIIADLHHIPDESVSLSGFRTGMSASVATLMPIISSLAACAFSGRYGDWYCFSVILLGIFVNGFSCFVIGSGKLIFIHPPPTDGLPIGDGFLTTPEQIVLLKGEEGAVNSVTRGKFTLHFNNDPLFRVIGICSMLLLLQSIAQFILVPQASLFGQLMFLGSILVSWLYNLCISSLDKERIQRKMLMRILDTPTLTKYTFGTRTSLAVFVAISNVSKTEEILSYLLPNDTEEWMKWKSTIASRLRSRKELRFNESDWNDSKLLEMLYKDAQSAYEGYLVVLRSQLPSYHSPP